jgi:hypothetical protein
LCLIGLEIDFFIAGLVVVTQAFLTTVLIRDLCIDIKLD